jgi:hypothetical protein
MTMLENNLTRRNFQTRFAVTIVGLTSIQASPAALKEIPASKSLPTEISVALKIGSPLLVFVELDHCPFCKIARQNYLLPLMKEQSIPVVQVNFGSSSAVIDAHGNVKTQDQLVRAWRIKIAPTILFLGKNGVEIAPRLTGGSTSDFYGTYLDERIRMAQTAIARDLGAR